MLVNICVSKTVFILLILYAVTCQCRYSTIVLVILILYTTLTPFLDCGKLYVLYLKAGNT